MNIETLAKQGRDRIYGGLAAVETSKLRKLRNEGIRNCFSHFDESSFRMEYVARIHGKEFINDAAACNVNATLFAMEHTEGSLIWIANGGNDDVDYTMLRASALRKVRMLICVGGNSAKLRESFAGVIPVIEDADSLGRAVNRALYCNLENVKVLYSPASSNGQTVKAAGEAFRHEVNEL